MNKDKIWIVTTEFPPDYGGGIATYCWEAGCAWASQGYSVKIITRNTSSSKIATHEKIRDNLEVFRLPISNTEESLPLGYWHLMSHCFAKEINKLISLYGKPDIIEFQDYGAPGYFFLKEKLLGLNDASDIKVQIYCHTPVFELTKINLEPKYKFPNYWIGQCEKFCLRAADIVISPSLFLKNQIKSFSKKEVDIVNYPYWGFSESELKATSSSGPKWDIVYAGRIEYRKGILQSIEQLAILWDKGVKIKIRVVGGDTFWAPKNVNLKEYIENKFMKYINLGLLKIDPPVPPDKLKDILLSGKIVLIPSLYENYPYIGITAMNLAKPVVASSSGGHAEMIGDTINNGFVFDWNKKGDFINTISEALGVEQETLDKIGANARKHITKICSYKEFVKNQLECVFKASKNQITAHYPFNVEQIKEAEQKKELSKFNKATVNDNTLSIIIPYYNLGNLIFQTIKSVDNSDISNKKIIIVNDGCSDPESIDVLSHIRMTRKDIKIIDISNAGLANARNVGALNAESEYIAFLDADDLVTPTYYTKCINILNKYKNVSFVYSWVKYFENSSNVWINFDTELPYFLLANMLSSFQVLRRNDFIRYGINDIKMTFGMEDYEAWLRMVKNGKMGVSIPQALVMYRVRSNSMSRLFSRNTVLNMYEYMSLKNKDVYDQYGSEIINILYANGPGYLWSNPTLNYPDVGYIGNQISADHPNMKEMPRSLTADQLYKIKNIFFHPVIQNLVRIAFKYKLDKYFAN